MTETSFTPLRVVIAGGGTGGHVFPALAIRQAIAQREPKAKVIFVGTKRGIEARVIPQAGETLRTIWISGFSRHHPAQNLLLPLKLAISLLQSLVLHLSFRPQVVIGTGGYVTGPVLWIAQQLRIPTVLQEQNSFPGWTTKKLAKRAAAVCIGFEDARRRMNSSRVHYTGNPLRSSFRTLSRDDARGNWLLDPARKTLLVIGGSLGARSINEAIGPLLPELLKMYNVIWQTGKPGVPKSVDQHLIHTTERDKHLNVQSFIEDMPGAYAMAELAICRAGAMTLAELAVAGVPAVLIPFPLATDDHQTVNATSVVSAGGAKLIADRDLSPESLLRTIEECVADDGSLRAMSAAMKSLARPEAALEIADIAIRAARRAT